MSGVPEDESAQLPHGTQAPAPYLNRRRVLSLAAGFGGTLAASGIASQWPLAARVQCHPAVVQNTAQTGPTQLLTLDARFRSSVRAVGHVALSWYEGKQVGRPLYDGTTSVAAAIRLNLR